MELVQSAAAVELRIAAGQLGRVGQRPGRERVLVPEVVVAGTDPPRPAGRRVGRAAPRVVPRQQVVHRVLAGARRAGRGADAVADPLEVLVEHGVAQVVAHLGRLGHGGRDVGLLVLLLGPLQRPVRGLDGPGVGVRRVGVLPLLRGRARVADGDVEEAVRSTVDERVAGRLRHGLPHRLLRAALEGVDVRRPRGAVTAAAEAVRVVDVEQPVHAVDRAGAVGRLQFAAQRVLAHRHVRLQRRRVLAGQVELGRVLRRAVHAGGRLVGVSTG